ncbi:MAG: hypothetical protein ABDH31_06945 [Chlorobiota bacterium]
MMRLLGHLWKRHAGLLSLWAGSVALGTVLLLLWIQVGWWLQHTWQKERERLRVQVICHPEVVPTVDRLLRRLPVVAAVEVITPEEGWRMLQSMLGIAPIASGDTLLPAICSAAISNSASVEELEELSEQLRSLHGVYEVAIPLEPLQRLATWYHWGQMGWYGVGGVVGLLWLLNAMAILRAVRRRARTYGVLLLLGVMPRQVQLPLLVGLWGGVLFGVLVGCTVWLGGWYLQLNPLWASVPFGEIFAEGRWQWMVGTVGTWFGVVTGLALAASSRRLGEARK